MAKTKTYRAKSLKGLAAALTVTLGLAIVALLAFSGAEASWLMRALAVDPAQAAIPTEFADDASGVVIFLAYAARLVLLIIAIPFALFFSYRSTANSQVFARGVSSSAGMAVFWWIIPVATLFKPYQVMSEAWRVGRDPDRWKSLRDPFVLRLWWGLHLFSVALVYAASITADMAQTAGGAVVAFVVEMAGLLTQALATALYIGIVNAVARRHAPLIAAGRQRPEPTTPSWSA